MSFVFVGTLFSTPTFAESLPTTVSIKPSLSIDIPSSTVNLALDPSMNDFGSSSTTITVATNNPNGYKLYLSSSTTDLTNINDDTYTIPTLASSTSEANFPANYWGYKLNSDTTTNYLPYQSDTLVSESTTATNGTSSTATFAAKVDYNKPAGLYSIAFDLKTIPIVTQVYMQDMTAEQCTTTPTIVIDKRDEHPYLVQRLKDGKCWMLDNLDLDLTNEFIVANLTTENTNIDTTNDPNALDYLKNGGGTASDKYAILGLEYHNWTGVGMTPLSPDHSYSQPLVNRSGKCDSTEDSGAPCVGVWHNADYTHNTILNKADAANTIIKDNANNIGGPGSYKIGTYYNYCAASAGTYCYGNNASAGTPPENSSPTSDICPAGWHMPSDNGGNNGDYLTLCFAIKGSACTGTTWNTMSITDSTSLQYQLSTPLSGLYISGTAFRQGTFGLFWSTTYHSGPRMRDFFVSSSGVYPQYDNARGNGLSVRCVSS